MKKVRFESPLKLSHINMENECLSPRPFLSARQPPKLNNFVDNLDALKRFEASNTCPYPMLKKSDVQAMKDGRNSEVKPSSELDLSILDASNQEPRSWFGKTHFNVPVIQTHQDIEVIDEPLETRTYSEPLEEPHKVTNYMHIPEMPSKDDLFFLKRNELDLFETNLKPSQNQNTTNKENSPIIYNKTDLFIEDKRCVAAQTGYTERLLSCTANNVQTCPCIQNTNNCRLKQVCCSVPLQDRNTMIECSCQVVHQTVLCNKYKREPISNLHPCCNVTADKKDPPTQKVNKKNWKLQRLEINKEPHCLEVETFKDSHQPTVADLYKIIQAQNEQLKILQEKVDNFISNKNTVENNPQILPVNNLVTPIQSVENDNHQVSIGVMTSFEMIRSSTVFNKEVITKSNTQVQCNQSYINITGITKRPDVHNIILDGITTHIDKNKGTATNENTSLPNEPIDCRMMKEMSLHDIQVDNATPMLSPEQSMYLDIKDYSNSTSSSENEPSNAGWTYYNKVMTHVNGMLQDSDMPSSASALYRDTRQHCMQMQMDKTDINISRKVTFDQDPYGFHCKLMNPVLTDTSIKMNQLAMKYLNVSPPPVTGPVHQPLPPPTDMSLATKDYMERYQLIQANQRPVSSTELPRFLDITALKRQTKLL